MKRSVIWCLAKNLFIWAFFGIQFHGKFSLKKIREVKVREAAEGLLAGHAVSCRKVAAFLGRVQSTTTAIPFARGSVRVIQWEFNSACLKETDYDKLMYLSEDARNELVWWKNLPEGLFLPITLPQSSVTVTTDATLEDYGIYYDGSLVSGKIPEEFADFSINVKELLPLDIWLDSVGEEVTNCVVTWRVDNNSALQAIRNEGSSKAWPLCSLSVHILRKALVRNIIIDPVRVSSEEKILDAASRNLKVPDWSLSEDLARRMFNLWGSPGVDLMATVMSRKAPMFFAWNREDPEAWGQDSLARDVDWTQFSLPYCFPPFPLVGQVLAKVRDQEVDRLILVAPWWPTKPWFSTLINMMLDCRRFRFKATITDMASGQPPPDIRRCHLTACLITGRADHQREVFSQKQLKTWSRHPGRRKLSSPMAQLGSSGVSTVPVMEFVHLPLL